MENNVMEEQLRTLSELLEERRFSGAGAIVKDMNPADAAWILEELPEQRMPVLFRLLPKELAADTFAYMEPESQELLVQGFSDRELDEVMEQLFLDDTVDMIEEMPANVVKKILRHVDSETRRMINQVLNYPKDSAGSIMTMEYVDLKRSMTVEQAFERIRRTGVEKETIYTCYVTDSRRKLLGIVTVKDLLLARKDEVIRNIMETNVKYVSTHTDQEEAARALSKYDFLALPVVDAEERLVGIVTVDDAIDVIQEEATEDIEKMAAIAPSDRPYMKTGVFATWRKRVPWLLFLMISATFTSGILASFEGALAASMVLTNFIPMLMDTGGNSGGQSSATIIRGLSLGEIQYRDVPRVLLKECSVAMLCGGTLALANFVKLLLVDRVALTVAAVVCVTLVAAILVANIVGSSLPILAKRLGLDPTVTASPLITTIVDAVVLMIYFNIAKAVLGI
ncbi:magnesium transporter [Acutalibacter muris]|jgi:magnesium transporter|uniref:Magnesium transporter MgtE n=2 Tax=Acutalibacter muris TaxID=1796620 RepID=A0ABN5A6P3_9FIRM|nr:magnesium transporter [Acutalibacter muris]ANU55417.1 magnesium transporter [Hungateiclostridiaceae bacterium KB18]ASB41348.1 magnesium transporter [Acutalibacter muris]MCI9544655.1 magnesium transporter [Acutalibacter muris]